MGAGGSLRKKPKREKEPTGDDLRNRVDNKDGDEARSPTPPEPALASADSPIDRPRRAIPAAEVDPALRRRRRLLFGVLAERHTRPWEESKTPREQFEGPPKEDEDFLSRGFEDCLSADEFCHVAESARYKEEPDEGYLDENAIEHLKLGLSSDHYLTKQLFKIAQAQEVPGGQRRKKMTCYELLALYSLLKQRPGTGKPTDVLELLFCVFDREGKDRVDVKDLVIAVDTFMGLQGGIDLLKGTELGERQAQHNYAKRVAERAIKIYGTTEIADASNLDISSMLEPVDSDDADSQSSTKPMKAKALPKGKAKAATRKPMCGCGGAAGRKRRTPALGFAEFQTWLREDRILPRYMADALGLGPPETPDNWVSGPRPGGGELPSQLSSQATMSGPSLGGYPPSAPLAPAGMPPAPGRGPADGPNPDQRFNPSSDDTDDDDA